MLKKNRTAPVCARRSYDTAASEAPGAGGHTVSTISCATRSFSPSRSENLSVISAPLGGCFIHSGGRRDLRRGDSRGRNHRQATASRIAAQRRKADPNTGNQPLRDSATAVVRRGPQVEVKPVEVDEQELTIKEAVILAANGIAIRFTALVQHRATEPTTALHTVSSYEDQSTATCHWGFAVVLHS